MAKALANLNVRLGFIFDTKSLAAVEKQLQRTGQRLAKTGQDISLFISAPLALMGAGAIKAAGEFESLSLAMQATFRNAGRTVAEANAEVEALRKAALAPGLDFQQAVSASIRLQSVGLNAEQARATIQELANAIASTGGTAENLSSVTVQMAQMISKGKVLAVDLRIIQENLPIVSDLMLKAFGTSNSEAIQDLGITGKQFVEGITSEMTKLSRVQGGISNAIVNAGSAIKQFLAGVGAEIARVFNITSLSDQFAAALSSITEGFKGLSDGTKKFIVIAGALLVAIGPITVAMGAINSVGSIVVGVVGKMAASFNGFKIAILGADAALGRLKIALGIVSVVVALGLAVYALSDNFDAAEFASKKFSDAQKEIVDSTAAEVGAINKSFAALKDETKSRFEKGKVVDALLKQYPQYLKGIDLETASVEELTRVQNTLNASILQGVAERQKAQAVNSIYEQQAKILLRIQQLKDGAKATAGEATLIDTGEMISAGSIAGAVIKKMEAQAQELGNQVQVVSGQFDRAFGTMKTAIDPALKAEYDLRDAAESAREQIELGIKSTVKDGDTTKKTALTKKELAAAEKDRLKGLKDIAEAEYAQASRLEAAKSIVDAIAASYKAMDQAALDAANADAEARQASVGAVDTSFNGPTDGGQALAGGGNAAITQAAPLDLGINLEGVTAATEALQFMRDTMAGLNEGTVSFGQTFDAVVKKFLEDGQVMQAAALAIAQGVSQFAEQGGSSLKGFAVEAAQSAARVVRSFIMEGVAAAAAKALTSVPFPFNIAAGGIAGALAGTLFNKLIQSIGLPQFAKGTNDAPGGLSLVGEKGPELINLPRHSKVFPAHETSSMLKGVGGQNINLSGEFRVKGTDLVFVMEQVQAKQKRQR